MMRRRRFIAIVSLAFGFLTVSGGCGKQSREMRVWGQIKVGMSREQVMKRIEGIEFTTSWYEKKEIILWRDKSLPFGHDCYVYVIDRVVVETDLEQ